MLHGRWMMRSGLVGTYYPCHDPSVKTSQPLYRAADLRRIEWAAASQPLMQRAGRAAADLALELCGDCTGAILVLAGPGNNGGDALEAARLLHAQQVEVHTVFPGDAGRLPPDAAAAWQRFSAAGLAAHAAIPPGRRWALIVDGLFGMGLGRDIAGPYASLVCAANRLAEQCGCPLLALDVPSGLDADTGQLHGPAIRASHTISFIAGKPGLFTGDGPDICGEVSIAPLGLDAQGMVAASGHVIGVDNFRAHLQPRRRNSHKGSYGSVGMVGGAAGMAGAALRAARAALRLGSGRVYVGLLDARAPALDAMQPELMLRPPEQLLATSLTALACGPGLGTSPQAAKLLADACLCDMPIVLDADALNLLAAQSTLHKALCTRQAPTLLTPHPAEAARLLGSSVAHIQADRVRAAQEIATRFNALVALKGCGTVVALPEGPWAINPSGNPGLATAGSGDVLTGLIVALLAQGWPAEQALPAAVHLHGCAADALVAGGCGPIGLTAGEITDAARRCLNQWTAHSAPGAVAASA